MFSNLPVNNGLEPFVKLSYNLSDMIESFAPVVRKNTRLLIIGSMPGAASLKAGQYYAHPRNQFWRLMFDICQPGRAPRDYADKLNTLLSHGIGLWDALARCERPGSLDTAISSPIPNDFPSLFAQYPAIHTLLFNGQAASAHFKRAFNGFLGKKALLLPSTSPAHAALSYEQKAARWRKALADSLGVNS